MRKYLWFPIFLSITAFALLLAPVRIYRVVGASNQELSSNERIGAGIADLKAYIQLQAKAHGVNPTLALWIVQHESSFDPTRMGDDGQSRGLWQISRIWHPEVTDACAMDI